MELPSTLTTKRKWVKIQLTRTGHPSIWEYGGSHGQTGHCQIVAGKDGRDLVPLFLVPADSPKATPNGWQALFRIRPEMLVIRANRRVDGNISAEVICIDEIDTEAMKAWGHLAGTYNLKHGGWDGAGKELVERFPKVQEAMTVAANKCSEYQCTRSMYSKPLAKKED